MSERAIRFEKGDGREEKHKQFYPGPHDEDNSEDDRIVDEQIDQFYKNRNNWFGGYKTLQPCDFEDIKELVFFLKDHNEEVRLKEIIPYLYRDLREWSEV